MSDQKEKKCRPQVRLFQFQKTIHESQVEIKSKSGSSDLTHIAARQSKLEGNRMTFRMWSIEIGCASHPQWWQHAPSTSRVASIFIKNTKLMIFIRIRASDANGVSERKMWRGGDDVPGTGYHTPFWLFLTFFLLSLSETCFFFRRATQERNDEEKEL